MVLKETDWKPREIGKDNTKEHTRDSRQEIAQNRAGAAEKRRVLVPGQVARAGKRGSGERSSETTLFWCRGRDRIRVELGHGAAAFSRVLVLWQEADSE